MHVERNKNKSSLLFLFPERPDTAGEQGAGLIRTGLKAMFLWNLVVYFLLLLFVFQPCVTFRDARLFLTVSCLTFNWKRDRWRLRHSFRRRGRTITCFFCTGQANLFVLCILDIHARNRIAILRTTRKYHSYCEAGGIATTSLKFFYQRWINQFLYLPLWRL